MGKDRWTFGLLGFGAIYFALASLTILLTRQNDGVSLLWVATAALTAMLVSRPRRRWKSLLITAGLASGLATGLFGFGWRIAPLFCAVNLTEAVVGALLMRRFAPRSVPLDSLGWLGRFVFAVGLMAPLVSGVLAAGVGLLLERDPFYTFLRFFIGHALGAITFTPVALLLAKRKWAAGQGGLPRELPFHLTLVALVSLVAFGQQRFPLLFLPILPIILAAFRAGSAGAAGGVVILALVGGGLTLAQVGPVAAFSENIANRLQFFQFFLTAIVLTVLPVAADLSHRRRLHRDLRLSEARHRLIAEQSTDIVMHLEVDGRIRYVSPSIAQGGYQPAELVGRNASVLVHPDDIERVRAAHIATIAANGIAHGFDYRAVTKDQGERWFETQSRAVVDRDGSIDGVLSFIRDVTDRKAVELRLKTEAQTDALTGLPNRRAFGAIARQLVAGGQDLPAVIAVLDIDHFKQVNDRFGHHAGDSVLRDFAEVARNTLRNRDVVARFGGEEFVLLLPRTTMSQASEVCERLRAEIGAWSTPSELGPIRITVSGGMAPLGPGGLAVALKRADEALYRAKHAGRDRLGQAA